MGKHERLEIENAEKIIIDLLNNRGLSENQLKNKWIKHCYELEKAMKRDFSEIREAKHIGNLYGKGEIGDIRILTNENPNWIYIELKMSESPKGKGTLANISQNALTTSNLFIGNNVFSWNTFRKRNNFNQKVIHELNKYKEYPISLNKGSVNTQISNKAEYLKKKFQDFFGLSKRTSISDKVCKQINTKSIAEIAQICCNIVKMAREDKISYLSYLKQIKQDDDNIKKFTIAMLIGYHTEAQLNHILSIPYKEILKILDFYYVYYTNEKGSTITISSDDLGRDVNQIIKGNIKIEFPEDQTNCLIKSDSKTLIRIVFHWKNKFQGIETPCLNIFKEF